MAGGNFDCRAAARIRRAVRLVWRIASGAGNEIWTTPIATPDDQIVIAEAGNTIRAATMMAIVLVTEAGPRLIRPELGIGRARSQYGDCDKRRCSDH